MIFISGKVIIKLPRQICSPWANIHTRRKKVPYFLTVTEWDEELGERDILADQLDQGYHTLRLDDISVPIHVEGNSVRVFVAKSSGPLWSVDTYTNKLGEDLTLEDFRNSGIKEVVFETDGCILTLVGTGGGVGRNLLWDTDKPKLRKEWEH